MTGPNGHALDNATTSTLPTAGSVAPAAPQFSPEKIKELVAALEVPFDISVIEWRVTSTVKNGRPIRGQVVPYADQRAYTDRLNALFTPAGWTRKYAIHASANFERSRDQKIVAKVMVTCEVIVFGLGSHSATGEEWADDDNSVTAAEAQAFKRSCACFGLGRYLYHFEAVWADLDDRKRPKQVPKLPAWATPKGWQEGQRPKANGAAAMESSLGKQVDSLVPQIERLAKPLGRRLFRGILRTSSRVWSPNQITDIAVQRKVLELMQSAERGLERLSVAIGKTGPRPVDDVLRSLGLRSLEMIDSLEVLKKVVLALEASATSMK